MKKSNMFWIWNLQLFLVIGVSKIIVNAQNVEKHMKVHENLIYQQKIYQNFQILNKESWFKKAFVIREPQ